MQKRQGVDISSLLPKEEVYNEKKIYEGKIELQTEEVILQSGEKTKSIGSDVINGRKEAENDIEESITNQDLKLRNDSGIQAEDEKNNEIRNRICN